MKVPRRRQEELDRLMQETLRRTGVTRLKKEGRKPERPAFPDLKTEERTAPCGNGFAPLQGRRELPADAHRFSTIASHKQGDMIGTPFDWKHGKEFTGGKKT